MLSDLLWLLSGHGDRVALVTADFGGIDELKPLPPHPGIDAFCYTDDEGASAIPAEVAATWTRIVVPDYPRHDFGPRLRAKYFKVQIHRLDEVRHHRWLAWADSSLRFKDLDFLREAAARLARRPLRQRALFVPHPERRTVEEEYRYVQSTMDAGDAYLRTRYALERMPEQMAYFAKQGWNERARLWCGTIWMLENNEPMRRALDDWWDQNLRHGIMDQLSLPVVLANRGIVPLPLDVHLWDNAHFSYVAHRKEM